MSKTRWQDLIPGIQQYAEGAWLAGESTTINGAAAAVGELRQLPGGKGMAASTPVITAFDKLEERGIATRDSALSSDKTRVIASWNFSDLAIERQTLRTLVEAFLAAPVVDGVLPPDAQATMVTLPGGRDRALMPVAKATRWDVLSALRAIVEGRFGAGAVGSRGSGGTAGYEVLLAACERISVGDLRSLPSEAKRVVSGTSGAKFQTALGALNRFAVAHNLVALVVPPPQHAHPWAAWAKQVGLAPAQRPYLYTLHATLQALCGGVPATPDDVSVDDATAAVARMRAANESGQGKRGARELMSVLAACGQKGRGPFKALATARADAWWMIGTGGADKTQSWESTAALLDTEGFPPIASTFYRWYAKYSMLPLGALQKELGNGFVRYYKREIDAGTSRQRHHALRTWLGIAVNVLHLPAAACTPHLVFGEKFKDVLEALRATWERRVEEHERLKAAGLPVPGHQVTRDSATLSRDIINAGLIADGLVQWAEWSALQGPPVATLAEIDAWRAAYALANAEVAAKGDLSFKRNKRTKKNLTEIMGDVSSLALVDRSNHSVQELIRRAPTEKTTAEAVQRALLGGIVAMGCPRIGELGLLEYQRHVREDRGQAMGRTVTRYLDVSAAMRKAGGDHQIPLPEEVTPLALWNWHRDHGRALLMAPWIAAGHSKHDFVFCSTEAGAPMGGLIPECDDQIRQLEATTRVASNASGALSKQYERWRIEALRAHPSFTLIEGGRGHHGPHASRNHITRLLGELGMSERLPYLVGHTRATSSEEMYGTSLAAFNAETIRRVLKKAPWFGKESPDVNAATTIDGMRGRSRAAQAQTQQDAALGRQVKDLLPQLQHLSPLELQRKFAELAEQYPLATATPEPPARRAMRAL